jgi:RND superfamily putative drug exporter
MLVDFDAELLGSLWRVVPVVLAITLGVLLIAFRSLLIPLKAVALNLCVVLAAYGFLVLVFQDGTGAGMLGILPPGGLNSLVVLMLFTVLFGISMDYEVFLLRQIQEEYQRAGDNRRAVETGVARSSRLIVSAAAIMVVFFGSFGFTQFTATRQFGFGLAFAVALDATVVRLLLVPALMELFGAANWWWPGRKWRAAAARRPLERGGGSHVTKSCKRPGPPWHRDFGVAYPASAASVPGPLKGRACRSRPTCAPGNF